MKNNKGFTLIELMIVVVLTSLVSLAIFFVYSDSVRNNEVQEQRIAMTQSIRSALFLMTREIRMIGYNHGYVPPNPNDTRAGVLYDLTIPATPTATSLTFAYVADQDNLDNDDGGAGVVDEIGELVIVTYSLMDSDGDGLVDDLVRTDLSGPGAPVVNTIAENIARLEFYYTVVNNNGTITYPATPLPQDVDNIRSIRVSILARSTKINKDMGGTRNYSFTRSDGTVADWSIPAAANDRFSYQLMSTVIKCRNMN